MITSSSFGRTKTLKPQTNGRETMQSQSSQHVTNLHRKRSICLNERTKTVRFFSAQYWHIIFPFRVLTKYIGRTFWQVNPTTDINNWINCALFWLVQIRAGYVNTNTPNTLTNAFMKVNIFQFYASYFNCKIQGSWNSTVIDATQGWNQASSREAVFFPLASSITSSKGMLWPH